MKLLSTNTMSKPERVLPLLAFLTVLGAEEPEISISSTIITPRLHMVSTDTAVHWRVWGQYRQNFGSILSLQTHFEYGSENFRFRNPFRIHDMLARLTVGPHTLRAGRMTHWSGLVQTRVDGAEYTVDTERFGSVTLLGGFPAVSDFSDTSVTKRSFFLVSWGKGKPGRNFSVTAWSHHDTLGTVSYVGSSWNGVVLRKVRISTAMAWNLADNVLHYVRLSASTNVGNQRFRLGVRNKRLPTARPYPWVKEKTVVPAAVTLGAMSPVGSSVTWWNQLIYRMGDNPASYVSSTLTVKGFQLTALAGIQGDRRLFGGGAGTKQKIFSSLTSGVQLTVNAVDYGDLVSRPGGTATGLYGWLSWNPLKKVVVRVFGQVNKNPYYDLDGRGGLAIHGTL